MGSCDRSFGFAVGCRENYWFFMSATVTISIMPVRHHTVHTHVHPGTLPGNVNTNWISIMNVPNQGGRQVFLYDHGRPHWSQAQGGPLFYDRRIPPPPPPQIGNFPNH